MIKLPFEVLKVGHCYQNARMACRTQPWRTTEFPALVGLLRHPTVGVVLFDTGYAPRFFDVTERFPEKVYRLTTPVELPENERLIDQLAQRGIARDDVSAIVVSHFHGDHICGLKDFTRAVIICARAGLDEVRSVKGFAGVRLGLLPALLPDDIQKRAHLIDAAAEVQLPDELAPFANGRDVFGDGAVIAIDLPGHATGQFGVLFTGQDGRRVLLAADAAYSMHAIRGNARPMALADLLLGHTPDYATTLARLHELSRRNPDVLIIPAHCPERTLELVQ